MNNNEGRARRLLVIYNPTAGTRARRRLAAWLACVEQLGAAVSLRETKAPRHAEALARAADPALVDAVVAAGGDGTVNEVVNGLADSPLPLGILPLGTANILAGEIGLPRRAMDVARILAFAPARPVWPGEAWAAEATAGRRFLIMAGIGFDADVVASLDLPLKRRLGKLALGKLAYAASIMGRLRDYRRRSFRAELDGVAVECASLVAAKAHFYGGRFVLAPAARLDSPMFQVVLFGRDGRAAALGYMAAMAAGMLQRCSSVRTVPARQVRLIEPPGACVQLDGDIHVRLPVTLRIAATPLQLIQPLS